MLSGLRTKGLLWPLLATAVMTVLLVSLGNWQMHRLAWKEGLIAAIKERTHLDPVPLDQARARAANGEDIEYLRVAASGQFLNDRELHFYAFDEKSGPGYQVFTPLRSTDGSIVIVNRGYVPDALVDPANRSAGQIQGDVTVTGLVRAPEAAGLFSPPNEPAKNIWFTRDLAAMAAVALGPGSEPGAKLAPFFIDAEEQPAPPGGWPKGGTTRLTLPNRHLEYALTWYGLAAALLGVFAAFAVSRLRSRPRP